MLKTHEEKAHDYSEKFEDPMMNYLVAGLIVGDPYKYLIARIAEKTVRLSNLRDNEELGSEGSMQDHIDIANLSILALEIKDKKLVVDNGKVVVAPISHNELREQVIG